MFKKKNYYRFRAKENLSALLHLTCFVNIETWKHSPIVLIHIFHAGKNILYVPYITNTTSPLFFSKNILYVPTKTQIVHLATFI